MEHLSLPRPLPAQFPDEDRRVLREAADSVQVAVDVNRRELDRATERRVVAERAADVEANDQSRAGRGSVLGWGTGEKTQAADQSRDSAPHTVRSSALLLLTNGVLASTWSRDRNGSVKCGFPRIATTPKLKPAASSWSTGRVSNSTRCCASFLNHSCSAFSAWIGPRQSSASAGSVPRGAPPPTPSIALRPRTEMRAGVPNRPNRNHVMPRTPTQPRNANPRVPPMPSWNPCWASHGVIASISSRYRNSTSNKATVISTRTIDTICPTARVLIASFSTWIHAKLPPMMMNRKNHSSTTSASGFTAYPVRSARSSAMVGRSVNVKIVASIADQNTSSTNAIHGTPGWREVESSRANGDVIRFLSVRKIKLMASRSRPQTEPMKMTRKRTRPNQ